MKWKILLDSVEKKLPDNWRDVEYTIKYDRDLKVYTQQFTTDLEFTGNAFDYINTVANSICAVIDVDIQWACGVGASFTSVFTGKIFVTDCVFDLDKQTVRCPVNDDNWTSLISNNKAIKTHLDVGRSKNDTTITAPTNRNIDFHNPQTGGTVASDVESYLVFDAFEFLVDFMTDSQINFQSPLFDTGGDLEGLIITTGEAINNNSLTGYAPYISFLDLFSEMDKLFNLSIRFNLSGATPIMIIDRESVIRNATSLSGVSFENVRGIQRSYKTELMYSKVKTGSTTTQDDNGGTFAFPDVVFLSHKEEEFHIIGDCNIDNTLDVVNEWVIDSNVIEDIILNSVTTYDDDIFIVETEYPATDDTLQDTTFSTKYVYNMGLSSRDRFANNYINGLPNSIAQYLGSGGDEFRAEKTSATTFNGSVIDTLVDFDDDSTPPNFDTNGNYNNTATNYKYTIPAQGFYVFKVVFEIRNISLPNPGDSTDITCEIKRYNSGAVFQEQKSATANFTSGGDLVFQAPGFYADTNDYIQVYISASENTAGPGTVDFDLDDGSYFECIQAESGGGVYETYDPEDYRVVLFEFGNYPLDTDTFTSKFQANPHVQFEINPCTDATQKLEVFLEELKFVPNKQTANFTVINDNSSK